MVFIFSECSTSYIPTLLITHFWNFTRVSGLVAHTAELISRVNLQLTAFKKNILIEAESKHDLNKILNPSSLYFVFYIYV